MLRLQNFKTGEFHMPYKEAIFWVGLTILGTGIYFLIEGGVGRKMFLALLFTVVGFSAVAYSVVNHYWPIPLNRIPVWVGLLLLTWALIGYDFYARKAVAPVDQRQENQQPASVTGIPTNLRLRFAGPNTTPTSVGQNNIWRWYALSTTFMGLDAKTKELKPMGIGWSIFLVFDKSITFSQISVDAGGSEMPPYEVKDSSSRSAVVIFRGDLTNVTVEIKALPPF
jgi:hypothetical protein